MERYIQDAPPKHRYVQAAAADMQAARDELLGELTRVGPGDWSRYVPYGSRTLHDLVAHMAGADQAWAVAAQGLLKGEGQDRAALSPAQARAARERALERGRRKPPEALLEEMAQRRRLLLSLFELLEDRHLSLALRSYGERHNSVRERIWLGYHDRLHAADVRRALRMRWHPQRMTQLPALSPAVEALAPDGVLYVIFSVDPVCWERPSRVPGWTYRQLLAHIATGDWVFQMHLRHIIETGTVGAWPDVDAGNEQRLEERRFTTHGALVEEYVSMRHETMRLLAQLKPAHLKLAIEFWWEPRPNQHTLLDYASRFHEHEARHAEQLRGAMRYARAAGTA